MLSQACKKNEALVHLSSTGSLRSRSAKHFCRQCADDYWARTPGMNSARDLIRLSNFYRSKLYDLLEAEHPEAFDNSTADACSKGSDLMARFLRRHLLKDNLRLNPDAFEMLCHDFFGSHHFYDRVERLKAIGKRGASTQERARRGRRR